MAPRRSPWGLEAHAFAPAQALSRGEAWGRTGCPGAGARVWLLYVLLTRHFSALVFMSWATV